ncbi:MAG: trehalose-phosphatase [Terracidiphilus sp.]
MSRSDSNRRTLSEDWSAIADRIQASRRVVIFLDFDGTLVDIAPRPEQVRLRSTARKLLQRLAKHPCVDLLIISGRRRRELLEHIGVAGIRYFGIYGFERNSRSALPRPASAALRSVRRQLSNLASSFSGLWVEDKQFSLSVHLLAVPPKKHAQARRAVKSLVRPFRKELRIIRNIRDLEIVPRLIKDKGAAVREVLGKPRFQKALPFYFGDDLSDESGFRAIPKGMSIQVGPSRPTRARYSLRNPAEVTALLAKLEAALSPPTVC